MTVLLVAYMAPAVVSTNERDSSPDILLQAGRRTGGAATLGAATGGARRSCGCAVLPVDHLSAAPQSTFTLPR